MQVSDTHPGQQPVMLRTSLHVFVQTVLLCAASRQTDAKSCSTFLSFLSFFSVLFQTVLALLCSAISRSLYRGRRPKGVQYQVAVKTSDMRGAGTSANVYLTMHGQQASGSKHQLTAGPHDFDR